MTDSDPFPRLPPAPGSSGPPPPPPPPSYGSAAPYGQGPPVYGGGQQYGGPQYAQPIGGLGPSGWSPGPALPQRNGLAIAALVLGLVSVPLFVLGIPPLLAFIFGLLGASRAKTSRGAVGGLGQARAGWILGVLGLAGCVTFYATVDLDDVKDSDNTEDDSASVFEFEVGHCYDLPLDTLEETTAIGDLDDIPCTEPHDGELIFQGQLNPNQDRVYPTDFQSLIDEAGQQCVAPFETYVGTPPGPSELILYPVVPNKLSWKASRGEFNCFVTLRTGGTMTSSVKGSGR